MVKNYLENILNNKSYFYVEYLHDNTFYMQIFAKQGIIIKMARL